MAKTIIAYDLGTGGNKASLYDTDGNCLAEAFVAYPTLYPQPGWHEQRPTDWWNAVVESTANLLAHDGVSATDVDCLAISGHSLGCVPLDAAGNLLREATPIWSDKRPQDQAQAFFERIDERRWYRLTGNGFPAAHYTVFKAMWYRDHEPEMFRRVDKIIGTKDFINFKLTGRVATDYSYASGSGVYDLQGWGYNDQLTAASGLPREIFPPITASTEILGELSVDAARELNLPPRVKVACGGVDNSCMALGARNLAEGSVYTSLGSSAWIAVSSAKPLLDDSARPYVFTHVVPKMFTSAMAIFSAGSSFQWLRDNFCGDIAAQAKASGKDPYEAMTALAASVPAGSRRLLMNPSLAGGSSLDANPQIRGALVGLDLGHTRADVIRATMEGVAMNLRLVLDELRKLCGVRDEMVAVGGISRSPLWRQILADALDIRIVKTSIDQQAGSLGAAALAAVGAGLWPDFRRIEHLHEVRHVARPAAPGRDVYQQMLPIFRQVCQDQAKLGDMLSRLKLGGSSENDV